MNLSVEMAWITATMLVAIRLGALFLFAPVFGSLQVPTQFRVLFILSLSALLVTALGAAPIKLPATLAEFFIAAAGELTLGALFAFGLLTAFGAFMLAGRIIDLQMGFGVASLIDPASRQQSPLLGTFLNLLAIALFFIIDGHHMIIRGLAFSLEKIPPGAALGEIDFAAVIAQFGAMFIYALVIVAPALFALLLLDIGMAVVARTMPQMNIFIVGIPLKIFVGLTVIAISLHYIAPVVHGLFESIFLYWERVLR